MAPPIPFTYLGEAFGWHGMASSLSPSGPDIHRVAGQHRGRCAPASDTVSPPALSTTYLPLGQVQGIAIGEAQ